MLNQVAQENLRINANPEAKSAITNKAEVFFATVAKEIYDGTLDSTDMIIDRIKAEMVSDNEFFGMFAVWTGSKTSKEAIRYILRKIHKHLDSAHEINIDNTDVHIEHIMPEDNTHWQVIDDIHDAYLWRLGNLALLSGLANISISNKSFDIKKTCYAASKIEPNKDLANHAIWDANAIDARQNLFAKYALNIWKK